MKLRAITFHWLNLLSKASAWVYIYFRPDFSFSRMQESIFLLGFEYSIQTVITTKTPQHIGNQKKRKKKNKRLQ
jgi:hypothetical protein